MPENITNNKPTMVKCENVGKKYIITHKNDKVQGFSNNLKQIGKDILHPVKSKNREDFWALKNIGLEIKQGERVGIIGKNGAGKSTLLKLLSRITEPTEGRIEMLGKVSAMLEVGTGFNMELTGRENIYLNGAILGMTKSEIDAKFEKIVEFSEVSQFLDTPVKRYSSGMFVRLAFAVASHLEPDILIIDEVLAVGDTKFQRKCLARMNEIANEGNTIICVSHIMSTIRSLCDRVIVLEQGKVIFDGDVEQGIKIYSGETNSAMQGHFNFEHVQRMYGHDNKRAKIMALDIKNNEKCIYKWDEPIEFDVDIDAYDNINHVGLRVIFWQADDTPVQCAFIPDFTDFDKASSNKLSVCVKEHRLSPGSYQLVLTLTSGAAEENSDNLDILIPAFRFEVLDESGSAIPWVQAWGNVRVMNAVAKNITAE